MGGRGADTLCVTSYRYETYIVCLRTPRKQTRKRLGRHNLARIPCKTQRYSRYSDCLLRFLFSFPSRTISSRPPPHLGFLCSFCSSISSVSSSSSAPSVPLFFLFPLLLLLSLFLYSFCFPNSFFSCSF
jgi:hypothetical protein